MSNDKPKDVAPPTQTHPSLDDRTQEQWSRNLLADVLRGSDDDDALDDDALDGATPPEVDARGERLATWAHGMIDRAEAHLARGGDPAALSRVLVVPPVEPSAPDVPLEELDTARIARMERAQLEDTVVRLRGRSGATMPRLHALSDEQVQELVRSELRDLRTPS